MLRVLESRTKVLMLQGLAVASLCSILPAQRSPFGVFRAMAKLPRLKELAEVSGIVASRANLGCYWVHGDKGDRALLIAIDLRGRVVQRYHLLGAKSSDWEDIAYGPGPTLGRGYLYLGDFGDNKGKRKKKVLVRVPEPLIGSADSTVRALRDVERFKFRYPLKRKHDAETLLIDPVDGSPYILTKEEGTVAFLYRYPLPLETKGTKTLVFEQQFMHVRPKFSGGDVSADGGLIVVRNRRNVFLYTRRKGATFASAFLTRALGVSGARQGNAEAIAFSTDLSRLVAISEGVEASVWSSRAVESLQPTMMWQLGGGNLGLGLDRVPVVGGDAVEMGLWGAKPGDIAWVTMEAKGQLPGAEAVILRLPVGARGAAEAAIGPVPLDHSLHGAQWTVRAILLGGESGRIAVRS